MSIGFRVFTKRELPNKELVEGFRKLPTANVADCMERFGVMASKIKLYSNPVNKIMVGTALTVKTRGGDNLMLHKAIDMAGEGDVIVVENEEERNRSLAGGIMFNYSKSKGIEGIVIDGPIRDLDIVSEMDWHIYATDVTSRGPYKMGPGEINVPVACGGVSVNPGDIILGDMDGVLVIPRKDAAEILARAVEFAAKDAEKTKLAEAGKSDRTWVEQLLQNKKVEIIEDIYRG